MRRLLLSSVACTALATAAPAQQSQVLVPTGPYVNLLSSSLKLYSLTDYCTAPCTTTAQQTSAFTTIAGLINGAPNNGQGMMWIPPGTWAFDTTLAGGPMVFPSKGSSIAGAGARTTTVTLTGGSFAQWTQGVSRIAGLRLQETDNPSSGTQISLYGASAMVLEDLFIGGGCLDLELASTFEIHGSNITISGDNSSGACAPNSVATGPTGLLIHKSSSGASHPSEVFFTNLDARGGTAGGGTKNSVVVSDSDGVWFTGGHIGISSGEGLLVQPEYADAHIDNFHSTGVDYDTASYGVRFAPYAGVFTGLVMDNFFTGGLAELSTYDGIRVDDPAATRISFAGMSTLQNGGSGFNFQAGSHFSIAGGNQSRNNKSDGGSPNVLVGGTTAHVVVSGADYVGAVLGGDHAPPYHIVVADTADYVAVGSSSYTGATTGDISTTSSGAHNAAPVMSSTDRSSTSWPNITVPSSTTTAINNEAGTKVVGITTNGSGANSNYFSITGNGSGGGVTLSSQGTDGTSTSLIVAAPAAGLTTLGNSAIGVSMPGPLKFASLAISPTAPTVAGGFCTLPSITNANGTLAFQIAIGSGCGGSTGTLTMPAAAHGWKCGFSNVTNPAGNKADETASTTTSVSVTNYSRTTGVAANWTSSDVIIADCQGF